MGWIISSHSPAAGLCLGPGHHQRSQQMQCFANVGPSCLANKHPELLKQHKPAGTLPPSSSSTKHITNFKKKKQGSDEAKAGHTQQLCARCRFPNHRQRSKLSACHGAPFCSPHSSSSISRTSKAFGILLVSD